MSRKSSHPAVFVHSFHLPSWSLVLREEVVAGAMIERLNDEPEEISETLFALWEDGLIDWNGQYRNGRKVWVITEKGREVASRL